MKELQQLQADLDKAKEELDNAAGDLANVTIGTILGSPHTGQSNANLDLRKTVAMLAGSKVDLPRAQANLARAQANCRSATSALQEFDHAQGNRWSNQSSEYFGRNVEQCHAKIGDDKKLTGSCSVLRHDSRLVPSGKSARALLVKETVMLLALVLAFLQFYLLDARLQVERLPTSQVYLSSQQLDLT